MSAAVPVGKQAGYMHGAITVMSRCSPVTFFITAGLFLLFLVGYSLFMFVSANTGIMAGLEATGEPQTVNDRAASERIATYAVDRAENNSKSHQGTAPYTTPESTQTGSHDEMGGDSKMATGSAHGEQLLRTNTIHSNTALTAATTSGTSSTRFTTGRGRKFTSARALEAGLRRSGGGPQQLPARSLVCVLGGRSQQYGSLALDGLCDVALAPFYALPGGDTFLNDDHVNTQAVLRMASNSTKTTYGIHIPLKKVLQARNDLMRQKAQDRMKNYWINNNVYHYAILDLDIGPNATTASAAVSRVFTVLKLFAKIQDVIRQEAPKHTPKAQPDAYVILGVQLWMSTNDILFKALRKSVRSFAISALIARTHVVERGYDHCKTNGPAPYEIENDDHVMGMANTVAYVRTFAWVQRTSLAVSFTLCALRYRPKKEFVVGVECVKGVVATSSSGALCAEKPDFFANQAVDKTQHTAFSWQIPDLMATYDTADTMQWKASGPHLAFLMCSLAFEYQRLNLAVALFDVECDDWQFECTHPSASHMRGYERTRRLRAYLRGMQSSSNKSGNVGTVCEGTRKRTLI
ncbi:hypothetical protein HPB50_020044 [Hyalomma asiaticum]|uniref:Uncharacterized protein n=1 Tax=Hyalomma asiaticum TaxID=266040 RepID=A0ACB7SJ88_HYAAI|nr:hypothetical protein HPB50_020044 [Hyalomma asiaticum]